MRHATAVTASLLLALCAGCDSAGEAIPAAQAESRPQNAGYTSPYSQMHSNIPAGAVEEIHDYQ